MRGQDRKPSFKTPPADMETSQDARRQKALEEQKRKRAQRVDSARNLDLFADLSLGPDHDPDEEPDIVQGGLSQLAALLPPSGATTVIPVEKPCTEKRKNRKPNTLFANKIMYAELLEMKDDIILAIHTPEENENNIRSDGLPVDLDTNWVALAPVPQGKRCLAVANQSQSVPGTVSNTYLKSRLKGRTILTFPSPLPPSTILDCILDDRWKQNGILHVLDIIRWKGQELGDCEANFRFWWRDTRLSELVSLPASFHTPERSPSMESHFQRAFSYPSLFLPVPYYLDLSLPSLLSVVIPVSRSLRRLKIPLPPPVATDGDMEIDQQSPTLSSTATAEIEPDGLLLYVSQASYDPGTTPLSSWVPIRGYNEGDESHLDKFEMLVARRASSSFQRQETASLTEVVMDH